VTEHEKAERRVVGRFAGNHMTTLRSALDPPALTCIHNQARAAWAQPIVRGIWVSSRIRWDKDDALVAPPVIMARATIKSHALLIYELRQSLTEKNHGHGKRGQRQHDQRGHRGDEEEVGRGS